MRQPQLSDSVRRQLDERGPRWLRQAEPFVIGGFIGGFGPQLQAGLSDGYPAAPWWMTYATAVMGCLVVLSPVDVLTFYYLRRAGVTRSHRKRPRPPAPTQPPPHVRRGAGGEVGAGRARFSSAGAVGVERGSGPEVAGQRDDDTPQD